MLHGGTEQDPRLFLVVGARAFVHVETYSKPFEIMEVEWALVGYSNNSKIYRVCNPTTRRNMESRRRLDRDFITPTPAAVCGIIAADYSVEQRPQLCH